MTLGGVLVVNVFIRLSAQHENEELGGGISHESFNKYIKLSKLGRRGKRKVSTRARGMQDKGMVCRQNP